MVGQTIRWLLVALRALGVCLALLMLLLQTYGLYIAAALTPHRPWRHRLEFRLHRALFALERLRLGGI